MNSEGSFAPKMRLAADFDHDKSGREARALRRCRMTRHFARRKWRRILRSWAGTRRCRVRGRAKQNRDAVRRHDLGRDAHRERALPIAPDSGGSDRRPTTALRFAFPWSLISSECDGSGLRRTRSLPERTRGVENGERADSRRNPSSSLRARGPWRLQSPPRTSNIPR